MNRADILSYAYTHTSFELPSEPILSVLLDEAYPEATAELLLTRPNWEHRLRKYWKNQQWLNFYSVNDVPPDILPLLFNYIRLIDLDTDRPIYFLSDHTQFLNFQNNVLTYAVLEDAKLRFNKLNGFFTMVYMRVMNDNDVDLANIDVVINALLRRVSLLQQLQQAIVQPTEQGNGSGGGSK